MIDETEVCTFYRDAKNPRMQIKILADMNCCSEYDIRNILEKHGYDVPCVKKKKAAAKPAIKTSPRTTETRKEVEAVMKKADIPTASICSNVIIQAFNDKIEKLVKENQRLEKELKNVYQYIMGYGEADKEVNKHESKGLSESGQKD